MSYDFKNAWDLIKIVLKKYLDYSLYIWSIYKAYCKFFWEKHPIIKKITEFAMSIKKWIKAEFKFYYILQHLIK